MKKEEKSQLIASLNEGVQMNVYFSEQLDIALTIEEYNLVTRLLVNSPSSFGGGYATEKLLDDVTVENLMYGYQSNFDEMSEEEVYNAFESLVDKGIIDYEDGFMEFHVRNLYQHLEQAITVKFN